MRKTLPAVAVFIFCCATVFAQTPFVPTTEGMKLEYVNKDKAGKVTGRSTSIVTAITEKGGGTIIEILSDSADADGKPIDQFNQLSTLYRISGEKVYALKETLLPPLEKMMPAEVEQDLEMIIKGSDVEFPYAPIVGQKLPDSTIEIWAKEKGKDDIRKFLTMIYSDRKIVAQEDVATEAGTFNCYKISETIQVKAMLIINMKEICETWYAPGIGVVLYKNYYKKKLTSTEELVSVSGRI